jgi:GT2 family glycosyltransferase
VSAVSLPGRKPRVLLAITVYNGRSFVPRCLESAKHLDTTDAEIDVLALDDASPEPGFSEFLEGECRRLGVFYYCTPRNLGIVRNVNMGLLAALEGGYDHVIISNSDVVYSKHTVTRLLKALRSSPDIGSVTAWSNNVSIFSIGNVDPDKHLAKQEAVDWVADTLAHDLEGVAVDVPAGISFCILIPTSVVRVVGLMDPVFGRGYCEETDWTLRSMALGYRVTLAPAAFVYHQGRASTVAAGLVAGGHSTVPANEAVIDLRYPLFRAQVDAFIRGGILDQLKEEPVRGLLRRAARDFGHELHFRRVTEWVDEKRVACLVEDSGASVRVSFRGFEVVLETRGNAVKAVHDFLSAQSPELRQADAVHTPTPSPIGFPSYPARV